MSELIQDLRFALRALLRHRGFALLGISTLALGIGATAVIFSVTYAALLRPLPFEDADRVMVIRRTIEGIDGTTSFSFPTAEDLQARNRVFQALGMYLPKDLNFTAAGGEPERLQGLLISADLPAALGVSPVAGRFFQPSDDRPGAERTVVLSHELWSRRFGADADLGSVPMTLDGLSYTVIGVFPPDLRQRQLGPYVLGDYWVPVGLFRDRLPYKREESPELYLVGRLAPGYSVADGQRDVERVARELAVEYPLLRRSNFAAVGILEDTVGALRPVLYLLLGAVGFVLLVACANLTTLLIARTTHRQQELATRMALGAGRLRLVRQILTETLLLGLLGAAAGLFLGRLGLEALRSLMPRDAVGRLLFGEVAIGGPVLAFTVLMVLVAVAVAGLAPAVQASRAGFRIASPRTGTSREQQRLRKILVGSEIAIALVLLVGALLMLGSLFHLQRQDPGFDPENVLSAQVTLPMPKYAETPARIAFFDRALEEIERLPGVRGAAVTSALPMVVGNENFSVVVPGDRPLPPTRELSGTLFQIVSSRYFQAMGIPLIRGREFAPFDDDRRGAQHVVIVNQALANHFWPGPEEQAIGQRIAFELEGTPEQPEPLWRQVVGVVGNVRHAGLRSTSQNAVYIPCTQPGLWFEDEWPTMALVVKTDGDPGSLAQPVRTTLLTVDPNQPIYGVQSLDTVLASQLAVLRAVLLLLLSFAFLAVVLAVVGVYGIVAQSVAAGAREIGTRVALGAAPAQVVREVMRQSFGLVGAGLVVGLAAAAGLSRSMSSLLFGIESLDPVVYAGAALALGLVAMSATAVPAWQAARADPSEVLRQE